MADPDIRTSGLIEAVDLLGDVVGNHGNFPSRFPGQVHAETENGAVAEFLVKGWIGRFQIFPEFFFPFQMFLCAGFDGHNRRDGHDDVQVGTHVFAERPVFHERRRLLQNVDHQAVDPVLLIQPLMTAFEFVSMNLNQWGIIVLLALVPLVVVELFKALKWNGR